MLQKHIFFDMLRCRRLTLSICRLRCRASKQTLRRNLGIVSIGDWLLTIGYALNSSRRNKQGHSVTSHELVIRRVCRTERALTDLSAKIHPRSIQHTSNSKLDVRW